MNYSILQKQLLTMKSDHKCNGFQLYKFEQQQDKENDVELTSTILGSWEALSEEQRQTFIDREQELRNDVNEAEQKQPRTSNNRKKQSQRKNSKSPSKSRHSEGEVISSSKSNALEQVTGQVTDESPVVASRELSEEKIEQKEQNLGAVESSVIKDEQEINSHSPKKMGKSSFKKLIHDSENDVPASEPQFQQSMTKQSPMSKVDQVSASIKKPEGLSEEKLHDKN